MAGSRQIVPHSERSLHPEHRQHDPEGRAGLHKNVPGGHADRALQDQLLAEELALRPQRVQEPGGGPELARSLLFVREAPGDWRGNGQGEL